MQYLYHHRQVADAAVELSLQMKSYSRWMASGKESNTVEMATVND